MLPWSPLASGFLSGKYREGVRNPPPGTRIAESEMKEFYVQRFENERAKRISSALETAANASGKTMSQVALNWLLSHPAVTAPILGARTPEQLSENLGSTGWSLSPDLLTTLDHASALDVTYPYDKRAEEQQTADRQLDASD